MFKTFNNDLMTKYIKALLADTYLYKIPRYVMYDRTTLNQFINFVN